MRRMGERQPHLAKQISRVASLPPQTSRRTIVLPNDQTERGGVNVASLDVRDTYVRLANSGHFPHSITSLALVRRVLGTTRPSAFAVLRLIANSNLVGSCTGSSAG